MSVLRTTAIPAFRDNYIWVVQAESSPVFVVDPGDATPVLDWLAENRQTLGGILITHHHPDHTGGITGLLAAYDAPVYGPAGGHIGGISHPVGDGDPLQIAGQNVDVLAVPGHTVDHLAFLFHTPPAPLLFCGDTLFAAGCGRLFEGDAQMMHSSLQRLAALPPQTRVFCAHEYTLANLAFATAAEPGNPDITQRITEERSKRERNIPTLPSTISLERRTNPFLRCHNDNLRKQVTRWAGQHDIPPPATDQEVFAILRRWKDQG